MPLAQRPKRGISACLLAFAALLQGCSRGKEPGKKQRGAPGRSQKHRRPTLQQRLQAIEAFLASRGAERCDVQKVLEPGSWSAFTEAGFRNRSVLLSGPGLEAPWENWTRETFLRAFGNVSVKANNGYFDRSRTREVLTVGDYLQMTGSDTNVFLVEQEARRKMPLSSAAELPFFEGFDYRPILSLGALAAPTQLHSHQETWLQLLAGRKAWWLSREARVNKQVLADFDPCASLPGGHGPGRRAGREWETLELCVQQPGEIMYFGDRTVHATCNLDSFVLAVGAQGHSEVLSPLLRAARHGDVATLRKELLEEPPDSRDYLNRTALQHAAAAGHAEVAASLLEARGSLEPGEPQPLQQAAEFGDLTVLQLLLDARASLQQRDRQGGEAIHYAAKGGQLPVLEELLLRGASPRARARDDSEPLHWAALEGNTATLQHLLALRADVHSVANDGATALHYAAGQGHERLVGALLDARARPEAQDSSGRTALQWAKLQGRAPAVALLDTPREREF